jgi:hypothetical protein
MCKWCWGTGFAAGGAHDSTAHPCEWCHGTGADTQATLKAFGAEGIPQAKVIPPVSLANMTVVPSYKATELYLMPDAQYNDLAARVAKETERRGREAKEKAEREVATRKLKAEAMTGFANFLTGCAHAMACRQALRMSKGHAPFGKTAQSGEMWTAAEGAELTDQIRNEAKGSTVRTNPLLWKQGDVMAWLVRRKGITDKTYSMYNTSYGY